MNYSPKKMMEKLNNDEFKFKKKYGQNFIVDENIINSIVSKSEIDKDTLVIEIGPGAGSLTYKLASVAPQVLCYEIDKTIENILRDNLKEFNNIDIIFDDFLKRDVKQDLKKYNYSKIYLIANLPYYITTPIIIKIIEEELDIDKIVVMVQKEVGDRIKAQPNTKNYNSLSVFISYYYDVKKLLDVSPNVFIPKPNVDSIVIELSKKQNQKEVKNKEIFFNLIKDSFKQKRKTIKNNLKNYDLKKVEEVLKEHNLDLTARAEAISLDIFIEISNKLTL